MIESTVLATESATGGCFLTLTVTVSVDLVADHVVDLADLVDSVVDLKCPVDLCVDLYLVLRSVEAFLLFTISVCCDLCLGRSTFDHCVCNFCASKHVDDLCVSHLMTVYLKLQCCGSVVGCPADLFVDLPHVSLVDLLADPLVDLITLLPLHNMVSPLPKCSMHLWTADWVMYWPLSQRRVACRFSLSISRMQRVFQVLLSWNCHNSPF